MTEITPSHKSTPLRAALDGFNLVFDYSLSCPILPEHVEAAAELAAIRGRQDIADELRAALAETLANQD